MSSKIDKFFDVPKELPLNIKIICEIIFDAHERLNWILPDGEEKSVGMRKLLEAKDCFVRSTLHH